MRVNPESIQVWGKIGKDYMRGGRGPSCRGSTASHDVYDVKQNCGFVCKDGAIVDY